jgi:SAM-dependent methyltransferase
MTTDQTESPRIVRTPRGARLIQDDAILSEILARPGATDEWFDVLAACVAVLSPEGSFLMLGFAGGGVVAPLRALGFPGPLVALDTSADGEAIFRELSNSWAGEVAVHRADAAAWLETAEHGFDLILEDLSVPSSAGVVKPPVCLDELPSLIARRLRPGGTAIFNLLRPPAMSWKECTGKVTEPFGEARVVLDGEYQNRIVLASDALPASGILAGDLRRSLRSIGSERANGVQVRSIPRL